ncbi:Arabinose operon regulatory protein [compost metagenome]
MNVTAVGYNQVWSDWRELDYVPDYNKFYLIEDGEGWLKIAGNEYTPLPGQWFLMPQGVQQSYSYTSGTRYTKYWCHFTAKIGENNLFDLVQAPFHIESSGSAEPVRLFGELLQAQSSGLLASPLRLKAAMFNLIAYYIEHAVPKVEELKRSELSEPLMGVIEYIHQHYTRNLTVSELAELVHVHPNYFIRVFKQHFGTSPIQYINLKKIEEAKWLLISTDLSLSQICIRVGISDVSYLSRLFKASTGYSPSAYRAEQRPN